MCYNGLVQRGQKGVFDMLEIGKKKLAKDFMVFTVPMGYATKLLRGVPSFCAVTSKLYGWRGYGYYHNGIVVYEGYEIIGMKLDKPEIDALCHLYDLMTEAEAKEKICDKLLEWYVEETCEGI